MRINKWSNLEGRGVEIYSVTNLSFDNDLTLDNIFIRARKI